MQTTSAIFTHDFYGKYALYARLVYDKDNTQRMGDICIYITENMYFYVNAEQALLFADRITATANLAVARRDEVSE